MSPTIHVAWTDAVVAAGGAPGPAAAGAVDLERRYAEPHRRYHTGTHVQAVLRDCAALAAAVGLAPEERVAVTLAACAHDVVYDARPGADERASADWAVAALDAAGVGPVVTGRVRFLVLATLTHDADATDTGAGVLLDADLAVLAGPPDAYAAYVRAVRAEYAAVTEPQWRTGRAAVLSALLERPRLYLTEPGRTRWDATARANVAGELAQLTGAS
jgi:predicted metal-dependent HD superfamily phosphohydrolase